MPEIANVISNEVIASEWGNDIRDRTIQRYADATERTALHTAPVTGDLSFLEDTGLVYVYHSGSWRQLGGFDSRDDFDGETNVALGSSYAVLITCAVIIPTNWNTWSAYAVATWQQTAATAGNTTASFKLNIDGTDGSVITLWATDDPQQGVTQFQRTGLVTTGTRNITLSGKRDASTAVTLPNLHLYTRATRLT